ncbi:DL-endopeptidase inhibitor IseA family protein [Paenibacillus wenxiniae]|uniref:DL-endopeptidase inhibitor IseA family protein n=1 Tax=Paenibacillus wenxiniae TaxID=1636843 RepID=A0ABW4RNR8_9BACL
MRLTTMLTNACLLGAVVTVTLYGHTGAASAQTITPVLLPPGKPASQMTTPAPAQSTTNNAANAATSSTPSTSTAPAATTQPSVPSVTVTEMTGEWGGVTKLNSTTAIPLMVEAQKRYAYVMAGGQVEANAGTFQLKGQTYRYLSDDIGTSVKLRNYLQQTFTRQASDALIGKYFIQYNGRTAQLDADGGSLLEWNRSTAKMLSMTDTARVYRLTVPYAGNAQPVERIVVKFSLVDGLWKINTAPHLIF